MSTALSGSTTLRSRSRSTRYDAPRMKTRIFQRPPTIACSTSWSNTVEPPRIAPAPATARMPAHDPPRRNRLGLRRDPGVDEPARRRRGSAPAARPRRRPGHDAIRRAAAPASCRTTTCTGAAKPGPASAIARSVAARTSECGGQLVQPAVEGLHAEQRRGEERAAGPRRRAGTATAAASRRPAHAVQNGAARLAAGGPRHADAAAGRRACPRARAAPAGASPRRARRCRRRRSRRPRASGSRSRRSRTGPRARRRRSRR